MLEESASKEIRGLEGVTRVAIRQDAAAAALVAAAEVVADLLLHQTPRRASLLENYGLKKVKKIYKRP